MKIAGAYEDGGMVVIEDDDQGPIRITWQAARDRYLAIQEMEHAVGSGYRSPQLQKILEQVAKAIIKARKKADPNWEPSARVSMFTKTCKTPEHDPQKKLIIPDG